MSVGPTSTKIDSGTLGLFIFGLTSALHVHLIGDIYLTDIISIPTLFVSVIPAWRRLPWGLMRPIMFFMALWFVSLVITDIYRATPLVNLERGWFKILLFATTFLCVAAVSEFRIGRLMAFAAGLACAQIISATFTPDAYQRFQPWKFGFGIPITTLTVIIASLPFRLKLGVRVIPQALMAVANLVLGFRSLFGILIGTVAVSIFAMFKRPRYSMRLRIRFTHLVLIAIFATISGVGTIWTYSALASGGFLGRPQQQIYEEQSQGYGGILFSDRSEFFTAIKAIEDSPIIGHGSWAADPHYAFYQALILREHGFRGNTNSGSYLIPSHSYILGAWVEAGLAGGVFWAMVLALTVTGLVRLISTRSAATPFAAFAIWNLLWNIPFSPFGSDRRLIVAGQLCVVLWSLGTVMPALRKRVAGRRFVRFGMRDVRG